MHGSPIDEFTKATPDVVNAILEVSRVIGFASAGGAGVLSPLASSQSEDATLKARSPLGIRYNWGIGRLTANSRYHS